jgi:hypothetical protein
MIKGHQVLLTSTRDHVFTMTINLQEHLRSRS